MAQVEARAGDNPTIWIALGLRHARALLADDEQAAGLFEEALGADLRRWPFQRARALLAYGQWLRRQRDRAPGLGIDHRLGVGIGNYPVVYPRYQVAPVWIHPLGHAHNYYVNVAAEAGVVGVAAFLIVLVSAFVIATHLYRIFPKLGIAARNELVQVLPRT